MTESDYVITPYSTGANMLRKQGRRYQTEQPSYSFKNHSNKMSPDFMESVWGKSVLSKPLYGPGKTDNFIANNCSKCVFFEYNFIYGIKTCPVLDLAVLGYLPPDWVADPEKTYECGYREEGELNGNQG